MKSKIRFIIVACFIAGVAVTGFNMAQNNQSTGVSLADIAVMAKANDESWDENKWYLYGNSGGTTFCCCSGGLNTCSPKVECPSSVCNSV